MEELEQAAHLVAADTTTEHSDDDVGCESTCSSGGDSSRSDTRTASSENTSEAARNTVASKSKLKSRTGDDYWRDAGPEGWLNTGLKNDTISIHEPTLKISHGSSLNDCTGTAGSDTTPHDCNDGVGDLTDNFKCLLTLQPHLHPTKRLIEEL